MKKFYTLTPLQIEGNLKAYHYIAFNNDKLNMEGCTSFPIVTAMNGYLAEGETFEVITATPDNATGELNFLSLKQEIELLCHSKKCPMPVIHNVKYGGQNMDPKRLSQLFQSLIKYAEDDDELFMCMTFGTKPLSYVHLLALQYSYQIRKNTSIGCILYGDVYRPTQDPATWEYRVYDMSSLVQLNMMVSLMAANGARDPDALIRLALHLGEADNE